MRNFLFALCFTPVFALAQSWTPIANFPAGYHHPVGWGLDGKGYTVTGSNVFDQPTKDFHEYDPLTDSWTALPDFPGLGRSFAIGVTYNGLGYLGFGATLSQYLNDLWSFNPANGQWTQLSSCPCAGRRHPAMVAREDKIYMGLGDGAAGNLRDWWVYDIATNSWSSLPDIPALARHHPFQFVAGNQVFAGMGHGGPFIFDDWFKLDTNTNNWVILNDFPGEARVAGTQFDHNGNGYVLSGDGDNHSFMPTGEFWQYDYTNDSWTQLPSHPGVSRWAPGSFVIGNDVYFFGGTNRQNQTSPVTAYKFALSSSGVGLSENKQKSFSFYPNPASTSIQWNADLNVDQVHVVNTVGQVVVKLVPNENRIDVSSIPKGIHVIQFYHEGKLVHSDRVLFTK